jgi:chromosome segregation ATPase
MFNKKETEAINSNIKELKETITKLTEQVETLTTEHSQVKDKVHSFDTKIGDIKEQGAIMSEKLEQEIELISKLNCDFNSRLNSLKILEKKAAKHLIEETTNEMKLNIEKLFNLTNCYKQLEGQLLATQGRIDTMTSEILKFQDVSKRIKTTDFELANFVKQTTKHETHKAKLTEENERLKTLIAKERGRRNQY